MGECDVLGARDARIAALARGQHGVVAWHQLAALGVTRDAVKHRVANQRLTPLHRGVYLVGPTKAPLADAMAAVLACGHGAALSHHAAAALHGFGPEWRGPLDVTVRAGQPRSRAGVRVRRARLTDDETTYEQGVPVTTPQRTIRDLATELPERELRRTIEEAQIQGRLDHSSLADAVDRGRGRRGGAALRAAAEAVSGRGRESRARRPSAGCSTSSSRPPFRGRWRTRESGAERSTSSGRARGSWSRSMGSRSTVNGRRSSATGAATPS